MTQMDFSACRVKVLRMRTDILTRFSFGPCARATNIMPTTTTTRQRARVKERSHLPSLEAVCLFSAAKQLTHPPGDYISAAQVMAGWQQHEILAIVLGRPTDEAGRRLTGLGISQQWQRWPTGQLVVLSNSDYLATRTFSLLPASTPSFSLISPSCFNFEKSFFAVVSHIG